MGSDTIYITVISVVSGICMVLIIVIIYHYISKKSGKSRVQRLEEIIDANKQKKIEPKIKRNAIQNQANHDAVQNEIKLKLPIDDWKSIVMTEEEGRYDIFDSDMKLELELFSEELGEL